MDDNWGADERTTIGVCVCVMPKEGVSYKDIECALAGVKWPDRKLAWHAVRKAPVDDGSDGWCVEATCSLECKAGDGANRLCMLVEATCGELVQECDTIVSAPCHIPFQSLLLSDVALKLGGAATATTLTDFLRTGLAASMKPALSQNQISRLCRAAERRITSAEAGIRANHPVVELGVGAFAFLEMGSRGGNRFDLLFDLPIGGCCSTGRGGEGDVPGGGGNKAGSTTVAAADVAKGGAGDGGGPWEEDGEENDVAAVHGVAAHASTGRGDEATAGGDAAAAAGSAGGWREEEEEEDSDVAAVHGVAARAPGSRREEAAAGGYAAAAAGSAGGGDGEGEDEDSDVAAVHGGAHAPEGSGKGVTARVDAATAAGSAGGWRGEEEEEESDAAAVHGVAAHAPGGSGEEATAGDDAAAAAGSAEDGVEAREEEDEKDSDVAAVHGVAAHAPWVRALVDPLLPGGWRCDVSVVYSKPGATAQDWHADGRHLRGEAEAGFDGHGAAAPYALCVFVPLIDLDVTVGFTQFWLGSHVTSGLIGFGSAARVLRGTVDGIVQAGGFVAYDYRLLHRGMPNASVATTRPVLQFLYARPSYRETKNYGSRSLFLPPQ
ncbi:hypothetical protein FOA52_013717 [Chlamydomonas sp. UWO 241]|nr:hypothetical protein FOA52_013717 [Chlamydomonas sp. UWO 241]